MHRGRIEVRKRLRISFGWRPRDMEGRQRIHRHDPGRDRGSEALREERAQRLVLPALYVARAPVVEEAHAEEMVACRADWNGASRRIAEPDEESELQLVVEPLARAHLWHLRARGHRLSRRA